MPSFRKCLFVNVENLNYNCIYIYVYIINFIMRFYVRCCYLGIIFVHKITLSASTQPLEDVSSSPRRLRTIAEDIEKPLRFYERLCHNFVDCISERHWFNIGTNNIKCVRCWWKLTKIKTLFFYGSKWEKSFTIIILNLNLYYEEYY